MRLLLETVPAALLTFAGTTLDDIFVVTVIFAAARSRQDQMRIVCGEYIGIMTTFFLGIVGALAANLIPDRFIGLLGLVPIALAIAEIIEHHRGESEEEKSPKSLGILSVALLSLSNGGDNIGVYIPMFASYSVPQLAVTGIVFLLCIGVFCLIAKSIGSLPVLRRFILRYKHILVPAILLLLGLYILASHYLF